jgi:hypothetical protein
MIGIILLIAVFICIASVFIPQLRKLAVAIIATGGVFAFGVWLLVEMTSK